MAIATRSLTRALWIANAVAAVLILAIVAQRLAAVLLPTASVPLTPLPGSLAAAGDGIALEAGERNPFDPNGTPWRLDPAAPAANSAGTLKGIVILPGVSRALTDAGSAKVGQSMASGRVVAIERQRVLVEEAGVRQGVTAPGAGHPRLKDLNQSVTAARPPRPEKP